MSDDNRYLNTYFILHITQVNVQKHTHLYLFLYYIIFEKCNI